MNIETGIFCLALLLVNVDAHCGCLKCSKDLVVTSPRNVPYQVIYRPCPQKAPPQHAFPYAVQVPLVPRSSPDNKRAYGYQVQEVNLGPSCTKFSFPQVNYRVQVPIESSPKGRVLLGLKAVTDRVVMCPPDSASPAQYPSPYGLLQPSGQLSRLGALIASGRLSSLGTVLATGEFDSLRDILTSSERAHLGKLLATGKLSSLQAELTYDELKRLGLFRSYERRPLIEAITYNGPEDDSTDYDYYSQARYKEVSISGPFPLPFNPVLPEDVCQEKKVRTKRSSFINLLEKSITGFPKVVPPLPNLSSFLRYLSMQSPNGAILVLTPPRIMKKSTRRKKRAITFGDESTFPFFTLADESEELDEDDEIVTKPAAPKLVKEEMLKPLNYDHIIPHQQLFYFLNSPMRCLNHFHNLQKHVSPMIEAVPRVLSTFRRYAFDFGRGVKKSALNFVSELVANFHAFRRKDGKEPWSPVLPQKYRFGRYKRENSANPRYKRTIVRIVDDKEVQQYIKERFSFLDDAAVKPTTIPPSLPKKETPQKVVLKRLLPKIVIDNNGNSFLEIDGNRRPLFSKAMPKKLPRDLIVGRSFGKSTSLDDQNVKEAINKIIEQVKMAPTPQLTKGFPGFQSGMQTQIIKEKIISILDEIQQLVNIDFEKYFPVYQNMFELQNVKKAVVEEWKSALVNAKFERVEHKVSLLGKIKEIQEIKDRAVVCIVEILNKKSTFNSKQLIRFLIRLQKLQCLLFHIVEHFSHKMNMGHFDINKDVKFVDILNSINFSSSATSTQIMLDLKKERDVQLGKQIDLLDKLKVILELNGTNAMMQEKVDKVAKVVWEIKNAEKLQQDSFAEIGRKIGDGQKIRRELKIVFDLQKHLEECELRQSTLITDITTKERGKHEQQITTTQKIEVVGLKKPTKLLLPRKTLTLHPYSKIPRNKPIKFISNGYSFTGYKMFDKTPKIN